VSTEDDPEADLDALLAELAGGGEDAVEPATSADAAPAAAAESADEVDLDALLAELGGDDPAPAEEAPAVAAEEPGADADLDALLAELSGGDEPAHRPQGQARHRLQDEAREVQRGAEGDPGDARARAPDPGRHDFRRSERTSFAPAEEGGIGSLRPQCEVSPAGS
jgi:hypothetical protein